MHSDEGVSLLLIHEHLMVPWNDMRKGDCCGRFETITDGYYCEGCNFYVHKKCSEFSQYIQHSSHSDHILQLRRNQNNSCSLCGRGCENLCYRCDVCDFDMDLHCTKYPPPELIDVSEKHHHKLALFKEVFKFDCEANCGKAGENEFHYECDECDLAFHVDCVWHPPEVKYSLEYTTIEVGNRVSLPLIHDHLMVPWSDMRKGDCCGRFEAITDGYYCEKCDFFVHQLCGDEASTYIQHPSHPDHTLHVQSKPNLGCDLCGRSNLDISYGCKSCLFYVDPHCAKYPPPKVMEVFEMHHHKLTLLKELVEFKCDAKCGKIGSGFPYECQECDLTFHVNCVLHPPEVERPLEVNHSYHALHPLKLLPGQPPKYSDGKCRLCGRKIDRFFYHCSSCNFTLDMRCVLKPPPQSFMDLKVHDHQLTLLPRLDFFTCNACGLKGIRSPYVCFQCGFMIHQECLGLPRVININRHDHRISRTSVLGVVDSVCGVCRKKVDWTYGGYSCQRCPGYVVHSKCATREDVWNGKELDGVPEEIEDIEPYVVIDENTINHFTHKEHNLRLDVNGVQYQESKRCRACCHPIGFQSFYGCIDCEFVLHQNCAELPKKKRHPLHNDRLTLITIENDFFCCDACGRLSNGFLYQHDGREIDVRCISISDPFFHPSHSHHPLYYVLAEEGRPCNACNKTKPHVLRCIEEACEFVLCIKCVTLPQVVKHRVDDHPLSLCYGEEEASGKYWCDICEKETSPEKWFYTCKDYRATLHTKCVLGDFSGLMPRSKIGYWTKSEEVVFNDSVTRPYCNICESHCIYPIFLKQLGISNRFCCSRKCNRYS